MATVGRLAIVLTASATDFERTMGRAARAVKSTEKEFNQSARRMQDIGRKWSLGVTAPIVAALTVVSKAAVTWEDTFADVKVTVQGTDEELRNLDRDLRKMTERIPLSYKQLSELAATAGRFGIQAKAVGEFTETMAKMGAVARVDLETAAMGIAQIDNVMGTGQKAFERYGATILKLGHALPTTEQNIIDFALQTAGAGRIAGLTASQILAIAGSFSAFGVRAQVGGTAVSKVLAKLSESVATGNEQMRLFAAMSGYSAQEFRTAWQEDAGEVFTRFVEGLGKSGDQAFAILRELGLSDQRLVRAFISVAQAEGFLRDKMALGSKAWEEATYLAEKAEERYKTVANRFKMLGSRIKNVGVTVGETLLPMLNKAVDWAEKLTDGLGRMADNWAKVPSPIRTTVINVLLLIAAVGPAVYLLGLLNKAIAGVIGVTATLMAFSANVVFAFTSWRGGAATLGESLAYLAGGKIKLVILAISALIVITILLAANWDKVRAVAQRVWGVISAVVLTAASLIVRAVGWIMTAVSWLIPGLGGAAKAVVGFADTLRGVAGQALQSAKTASAVAEGAANVADTADNAAKSQNDLADGLANAAKAAKSNLQSFDEIHQLQSNMAGPELDYDFGFDEDAFMPQIPSFEIPGAAAVASVADTFSGIADKLASAWDRVKRATEPVNKAVQWIKDNWPTIGPVVQGIATAITVFLLPALIKTGVEAVIAGGKLVATWAMAAWGAITHGAAIVGQLIVVVAKWAWAGIQALIHAGKVVLAWAMQGWSAIASVATQVAQFIVIGAKWVWLGIVSMANAAKIAGAWLLSIWPIALVIAAVVGLAVVIWKNWDSIKTWTVGAWGKVADYLAKTWEGIKKNAGNVWNGITNTIKAAINGIIKAANWMINGLNQISFSPPSWVPSWLGGGKTWGVNIPLIPTLATGTNLVPKDMVAYLHAGEAVVPKQYNPAAASNIGGDKADAIARAVHRAVSDALRSQGSGQSGDTHIVLEMDGDKMAEKIIPKINRQSRLRGKTALQT